MSHSKSNLPVVISAVALALSSFLPVVLSANTERESGPLDHLDGYNGITVTVAAGAALVADQYRYRRLLEANRATEPRPTIVVRGTGATLLSKPADQIVDLAMSGTRHGDVVSIDYTPGTVEELKIAVSGLKESELAWEKRVQTLSKELKAVERRRTVARHQLAELPLKDESRDARERAQTRLSEADKEFGYVKKAELDAQARMHHARGLYAAEKLNLDSSIRNAEALKNGKSGVNRNVITTAVRIDYPVDETTRKQLLGFVEHVTKGKLPRESKAQLPKVRITRVNMPSLVRTAKLLKESRRGAWGIALAGMVAVEEVTAGYLADGLRQSIEPSAVVPARNAPIAR
jgi:hypothetical protein